MLDLPNTLPGFHGPARIIVSLITVLFMLGEYAYGRLHGRALYDRGETVATALISIGGRVVNGVLGGVSYLPLVWAYEHRLFTIPMRHVASVVALFLATEFFYYWHHVAMHKVRWFWATHLVHHSATRFNLSAAVRLGWGANILGGVLFYLPLAWFGFPPLAIATVLALGLLYQFGLHLAEPPRLGVLEYVLNTPTHHRIHHATNEACLDKNFGAVLIVYDRLFGTFASAPVGEPLRFGLKDHAVPAARAGAVLTAGWRDIIAGWRQAATWPQRFAAVFGRP